MSRDECPVCGDGEERGVVAFGTAGDHERRRKRAAMYYRSVRGGSNLCADCRGIVNSDEECRRQKPELNTVG